MTDRNHRDDGIDCDDRRVDHPADRPRSGVAGEPASLYDRWARAYDLVARRTPGIARLRARAVDALKLERGDTVVDVGCGTGANLPLLAREVGPRGRVVGVDVARGSLERARRNARGYPQIDVVQADATRPPIEGDVDAVLATFLVGMLPEPADAVDAWCELLEDGGGHVALLHMRRSDHLAGPLLNAGLGAVTRVSTPPLTKLRYDASLTRSLDRHVREAGDALRASADVSIREPHALGLVELVGGRFE